jgi:hypothetical protein
MTTKWWVQIEGRAGPYQVAGGTVQYGGCVTRRDADSIAATLAAEAANMLGLDPVECCRVRRENGRIVQRICKRERPGPRGSTWRVI